MASRINGAVIEDDGKKSKVAIIAAILFVILALSFAFFWNGNIAYGVIMIAIPSAAIIMSTCCYMSEQNDDEDTPAEIFNMEFPTNDDNRPRLPDRPPSYRQTWRRSFIKRLRTARQSFTEQYKADENSDPEDRKTSNSEEPLDNIQEISSSDSPVASPSVQNQENNENPLVNPNISSLKYPVVPKDSLPTYDEAFDIMKSMEDLNRVLQ